MDSYEMVLFKKFSAKPGAQRKHLQHICENANSWFRGQTPFDRNCKATTVKAAAAGAVAVEIAVP